MYEPPGALYPISANARETEPSSVSAFLVVPAGEQEAVVH